MCTDNWPSEEANSGKGAGVMDTLTPRERSERMRRVRGKDTRPELAVRRLAHKLGFRYRLHSAALPGHPDMVFTSRRKVLFVHGCFWHRHAGCGRLPKSRLDFWISKLEANKKRDRSNHGKLRKLGWNLMIVWECQLKDQERLARRLRVFLECAI